jgi:adenylyltransferase/sulfurtransferase
MKLQKNNALNIDEIFQNSSYLAENCDIQDNSLLISNSELKSRFKDSNLEIISVINNVNTPIPFEVHQKRPFISFNLDTFNPNFEKDYIIVCNKGITSYEVTKKIKEKFPKLNVFSLVNGIENY